MTAAYTTKGLVQVQASRRPPPPPPASVNPATRPARAQAHTDNRAAASAPPAERRKPATRLEREKKRDFNDPPLVGPWKIGALIGTGATGTFPDGGPAARCAARCACMLTISPPGRVRLVHHVETGYRAAVKIIPRYQLATKLAASGSGPEVQKRLQKMEIGIEREIVVMRLIMHQNLLSLIDVYENEKVLYLIMEYVEGGELFDHLVHVGRLDVDTARDYFRQIMFGVDHCHSFNICHRDLKPENLLLSKDKRQVKIADFGMAALQHSGRMLETSCGSPHYASPEIVSGKRYVGTATDIWSCGIILFALLCARLPFDDPNMSTLLQKVKDGRFDFPRDIRDEAAKDLVRRMLVVDPRKRYTMIQIFHHPWFTNFGRLSSTNPVPVVADAGPIDLPTFWEDDDIFRGLTYLFQGYSKEQLKAELCSPADTQSKRFYRLLLKDQLAAEEEEEDDDGVDLVTTASNGSSDAHPAVVQSSSGDLTGPSSHSKPRTASLTSHTTASSPNTSPAAASHDLASKPPSGSSLGLQASAGDQANYQPHATPISGSPPSSDGVTPQGVGVALDALASLQAHTSRQSHGRRPSLTSPPVAPSAAAAVQAQRVLPISSPQSSQQTNHHATITGSGQVSMMDRPPAVRRASHDTHPIRPSSGRAPIPAAFRDTGNVPSPNLPAISAGAGSNLPAIPNVGDNAAVQRFFQEVAAELASIRAEGGNADRSDRLQARVEQMQTSSFRSSSGSRGSHRPTPLTPTPAPPQVGANAARTTSTVSTSTCKATVSSSPHGATLSVPPSPAYRVADLPGSSRRASLSSATSRGQSGGTTPRSDRFQDADEDEVEPEREEGQTESGSYLLGGHASALSASSQGPASTLSPSSGAGSIPSRAGQTPTPVADGRASALGALEPSHLVHAPPSASIAAPKTRSATNSPFSAIAPTELPPLALHPSQEGEPRLPSTLSKKGSYTVSEGQSRRPSIVGRKPSGHEAPLSPRINLTPPQVTTALPGTLAGQTARTSSRRASGRTSTISAYSANLGVASPVLANSALDANSHWSGTGSSATSTGYSGLLAGGSLGRATGMGALTNALGLDPQPSASGGRSASSPQSRPPATAAPNAPPHANNVHQVPSYRKASGVAVPMAVPTSKPKRTPSLTRLQQRNPGLAVRIPGQKDESASSSSNVAATPVSDAPCVQSPRQASWFGSIFNWKPSVYTLYSSAPLAQTRQALLTLLPQVGSITVADSNSLRSGAVTLKGTASGARKAVRFRAELTPLNSGTKASPADDGVVAGPGEGPAGAVVRVRLLHERGSHATLKSLHLALREQWRLDPVL